MFFEEKCSPVTSPEASENEEEGKEFNTFTRPER